MKGGRAVGWDEKGRPRCCGTFDVLVTLFAMEAVELCAMVGRYRAKHSGAERTPAAREQSQGGGDTRSEKVRN